MEKVYANIEILNANNIAFLREELIEKSDLNSMKVICIVDFNIRMLCINEIVQDKLKFPIIEKKVFRMNDNTLKEFEIVSGVIVKFKNRQTCCRALILPANEQVILGMIPLNGLDVSIKNQNLIVKNEFPTINLPSIF